MQKVVFAVGVVGVAEIKLQRVVVVLAEIHKGIHLLGGQGVFGHDAAGAVHHTGTVAGNGVIKADAAQLAFALDGGPAPPGAEDEPAAGRLHFLDGFDHGCPGHALAEGHKGVVVVAGE